MSELPVTCSIADGIATVTIDRPDKRNALNDAVIEGFLQHFEAIRTDDDARVVVITGAGEKAFCAGGDLSSMPSGGLVAMHRQRHGFVDLIQAMASLGKPIIGRVNGQALGGGFGLMLACDLVVAADDIKMGTPEIKVGLFPMMIMALIFRNIGRKKGMELMLTGDRITAHTALDWGILNRCVPRAELDESVHELASKIAGYSPAVLELGRNAFYATQDMDMGSALEHLHAQLTLNTLTEDAAEGVMAFLSKRKPEWKGR